MKPMDFMIIGAQKSATTALFRNLQSHPDISMPAEKEAPLFLEHNSAEETQQFMTKHFDADPKKLLGKATPQYMCDEGAVDRIYAHNPNIKLIAVLRDPAERAFSHYLMNRRRQQEHRSFDTAIEDLLEPKQQTLSRQLPVPGHQHGYESEGAFYIAWGEYGRILKPFIQKFGRQQILVIYSETLKHQPAETLDCVLTFLGLGTGYRPDNLGTIVHKGSDQRLIPDNIKAQIKDWRLVSFLWNCIPEHRRRIIRYWYEQFNVRHQPNTPTIDPATARKLTSHFASDTQLLVQLTSQNPPWHHAVPVANCESTKLQIAN